MVMDTVLNVVEEIVINALVVALLPKEKAVTVVVVLVIVALKTRATIVTEVGHSSSIAPAALQLLSM